MNKQLIADLNKSLNLGIESNDATPNIEDITGEDLITESETTSADSIQDIEENEATEDLIDTADESLDAGEAVEDLVTAVESARQNGQPLSRIEAAALTVAFHQVTKKFYKDPVSLLPARESHQSYALSDLNLASESFKETAKNLYKKSVDVIKEIFKKLGDLLARLVDKYGHLERRYSAIYKTAKEKTDIESGVYPNAKPILSFEGRVDLTKVKEQIGVIADIEWLSSDESVFALDDGKKTVRDNDSTHGAVFAAINTNTIDAFTSLKDNAKVINGGPEVPEDVRSYFNLLGGKFVGIGKLGETDTMVWKFGDTKSGIDKENVGNQIDLPGKEEILKDVPGLINLIKRLKMNSTKKRRLATANDFVKTLRTMAGGDETLDSSESKEIKLLTRYASGLASFLQRFGSYSFDILFALAEVYEAAIKTDALEGSAETKQVEETA